MRLNKKINISRIFALALALMFVAMQGVLCVSAASEGVCGDNLKWTYSAGTLTISGDGAMTNFTEEEMAPWYPFRKQIRRVVLPEGVTSIGNLAFYDCENITAVTIPDSVKTIGTFAFSGCTSLAVVDFGVNIEVIAEGAFYDCVSLKSARLPIDLTSIGTRAFYRCESLMSVTVPSNVTHMGHSVFAYCKSLVKAEISADILSLPAWTFYGCDCLSVIALPNTLVDIEDNAFENCEALSTVHYSGTASNIGSMIAEDIPGADIFVSINSEEISDSGYFGKVNVDEAGSEFGENTTVTENENITSSVTVKTEKPQISQGSATYLAEIVILIENDEGWTDALNVIKNALKTINTDLSSLATSKGTYITVYLKNGVALSEPFFSELAGRPLNVTFISDDGSSWTVDFKSLDMDKLSGMFNYSYGLSEMDKDVSDELGTDRGYILTFNDSAKMNAELKVQLPDTDLTFNNAYLYQIDKKGKYTKLQAVEIDLDNVAHFYLANVDSDTKYVIGINVPDESGDDVIVYQSPFDDLNAGAIARLEKIDYVVTGTKSSWGLSFWQVTIIMIIVLAVLIITVGTVLGATNKNNLRREMEKM